MPANVTFTPKIPANCYDGLMHKKLHAVNNIVSTETDKDIVVNFRTYVLDCGYNKDGVMTAAFYGPIHAGRCDHTVLPYAGVRVESFVEPLAPVEPYDKINICNVTVSFDKRNLQANGISNYEYKYRFGSLIEYGWWIGVGWDKATNTYRTEMKQGRDQVVGPVHHNLDRTPGPNHLECNEYTYGSYKRRGIQGWTVESPVAKVAGGKLHLSFYVTGVSCMHDPAQEFGRPYIWGRDKMPRARTVVIRNSAHSPANYDWNIYRQPVENPYNVENLVNFDIPLAEVMENNQQALYKKGEVAQVHFKVYIGVSDNDNGRGGVYDLILNLDPKVEEAVR